jgi:bifunctional polynucleotide phosphatase/kinase
VPKPHRVRLDVFKRKVAAIFAQLDLPIIIFVATEKDIYRKPRTGIWTEILKEYNLKTPGIIDLGLSFFVGDAGGRLAANGVAKDFSCSDR